MGRNYSMVFEHSIVNKGQSRYSNMVMDRTFCATLDTIIEVNKEGLLY